MASDHLLTNQGACLIASEGTYNTDAIDGNLGGSNTYTFQAFTQCDLQPVLNVVEFPEIRQSFDAVAHKVLNDHLSVNIAGTVRGATNPGNAGGEAPHWAPLLKAAGLSETISSGVSATYAPSTQQTAGMTCYRYIRNAEDGSYRMIYGTGIRLGLSFNFAVGAPVTYTATGLSANMPESSDTANFNGWSDDLAFFNSSGEIILDKDGSTAITPTLVTAQYDTRPPLICESITATVNSVTYPLASLSFNTNKGANPIRTINNSNQTSKVLLMPTDRPGGTGQLLQSAAAYEDLVSNALDATEIALSVVCSNGTDRLTFTASKTQLYMPSPGDSGGVLAWSFDYRANGVYTNPSGNDAYYIVFDAAP